MEVLYKGKCYRVQYQNGKCHIVVRPALYRVCYSGFKDSHEIQGELSLQVEFGRNFEMNFRCAYTIHFHFYLS